MAEAIRGEGDPNEVRRPQSNGTAHLPSLQSLSPSTSFATSSASPSTTRAVTPNSSSSRSWLRNTFGRRPKTASSSTAAEKRVVPTHRPRSQQVEDEDRRDSKHQSYFEKQQEGSLRTSGSRGSKNGTNSKPESVPAIVVQDEAPIAPNTSEALEHDSENRMDNTNIHDEEQEQAPSPPPKSGPEPTRAPSVADTSNPGGVEESSPFRPISTAIPSGSFDDLTQAESLQFSNRGSLMLLGKRTNMAHPVMNKDWQEGLKALKDLPDDSTEPASKPDFKTMRKVEQTQMALPRGLLSPSRLLSPDEILLSRKVRFMYEHGDEKAGDLASLEEPMQSHSFNDSSVSVGVSNGSDEAEGSNTFLTIESTKDLRHSSSVRRSLYLNAPGQRQSMIIREENEIAGGIEDWDDVKGDEVDRYGFIIPRKAGSRDSDNSFVKERPGIQRVSTVLQMASEAPRKPHKLRRMPSQSRSVKSATVASKRKSDKSLKPAASMYSYQSNRSFSSARAPLRYAANRLPHNRDRRCVDEAGDMLTLPPGLADIAEQEEGGKAALELKKKEWQREEKWRKMGRQIPRRGNGRGGGMIFDFDAKDPKVISRTWKGIPDRWRATAWYAFLAASTRHVQDAPSEDELIEKFHELQEQNSADDMQIDVDVPRTIGSHIMFRRRYRGGYVSHSN
jgi:hypothetical protein